MIKKQTEIIGKVRLWRTLPGIFDSSLTGTGKAFTIPGEFHKDFRECRSPKLRLETAIQEARAFLLLMSDAECGRVGSYTGQKGEALHAGIVSLSRSLGDELAAAFYAAEDAP